MIQRVLFQLGQALLISWGTVTMLFLLTRTLPDEQELIRRFSLGTATYSPSASQVRAARQQALHRLGMDIPVFYLTQATTTPPNTVLALRWQWTGPHNQYHRWLTGLLRGDAGRSYRTDEPVNELLYRALHHTFPLALLAAVLIIGLSVPLGMWLAISHRGFALAGLFALDALPLFVVALLLLFLLANPDTLALFPSYGLGTEAAVSFWNAPSVYFSYLALPLASLVLTGIAEPALQLAAALRTEAAKDYMLAAQAKGLSATQALRRHGLRNALLPTITLFTELLPTLLAGSLVVELIFALPGLGRLLAESAAARDYPVLLAGALLVVVVRQVSLWLADGLYLLADPRLIPRST